MHAAQGDNPNQKDLFISLLSTKDPETRNSYTNEELIAEAGVLIVVGSDTTATSLISTIFYLLHHPSALSRVQIEVCATSTTVEEIRISAQLSSCRFLFDCIDEAMRLSPAVGAILPRGILPGSLVIDGNYFRPGIDVGVPIYCIHHDETYFPDPFAFNPERWLSESGTLEAPIALA
ncbi:MAG: hypothetical protein Q9164_004434 [Protoblastenia rupestris]